MATYIKTILVGPVNGGLKVTPDKIDPYVNNVLDTIQKAQGKILDVKIALAPLTAGEGVTKYLIVYEASQPVT